MKVYLISNIEEYGKFISYCIDNDISVWRTYWDDREKGERCYHINWKEKRCYYSDRAFYDDYKVIIPIFELDSYGRYKLFERELKE